MIGIQASQTHTYLLAYIHYIHIYICIQRDREKREVSGFTVSQIPGGNSNKKRQWRTVLKRSSAWGRKRADKSSTKAKQNS